MAPSTRTRSTVTGTPLTKAEVGAIDAWWRAANYLSVGQIYLMANPLLREPLLPEHVKPRLLGHWGTTPGLNFVYAHMNRAIRARDLNAFFESTTAWYAQVRNWPMSALVKFVKLGDKILKLLGVGK